MKLCRRRQKSYVAIARLNFFGLPPPPPSVVCLRLDSVVTVVDADALLHQLQEQEGAQGRDVVGEGEGGGDMLVSMKRQLESADVVLLNKADLVDDQG